MRILFDNLLSDATLSAGGTSLNYPLANLNHAFLKKKFQQTVDGTPVVSYAGTTVTYDGEDVTYRKMSDEDALTLTWDSDKTIDSIFIGYSNAIYFTLRLLDVSNNELFVQEFTNAEMGSVFPVVSGVRKAMLYLDDDSDPMTVYLGGLGIGVSYAMPDPINDWSFGQVDNSIGTTTLDGQVLGQYIEPLKVHLFNFKTASRAMFFEVYDKIKTLGKYTPIFYAPFESAMATVPAMYATIEGGFESPSKDDNIFSFSLTFAEAR